MGVCVSSEVGQQRAKSRAIEEQLHMEIEEPSSIKILHRGGFSKDEIEKRKIIVRNNVIDCMLALLKAMKRLDISFGPQLQLLMGHIVDFEKMLYHKNTHDALFPTLHEALTRLWKDSGVQKCYGRRNEFILDDCAKYFFDNLDRICSPSYQATNQDILHSRAKTAGVEEIAFEAGPIKTNTLFRVFTYGGQRSERRKWIDQFEVVDSVIFIAALSDYITTLHEQTNKNALEETLDVFESVISSEVFCGKPMILFLNKKDLFRENLLLFPLKDHFPEYEGGENYKKGIKFMKEVFSKRNRESSRKLHIHRTCATDTDQVEKVIDSVIHLITTLNAERTGME